MTDPATVDPRASSAAVDRALFEDAACGLLTVDAVGAVTEVNETLLGWLGVPRGAVVGSPFLDLLPSADRLFFETRFAPVLQLQGEVREVALAMVTVDGGALPILLNGRRTDAGIRMAVFDATQRQNYERALLQAQRAAQASEVRVRTLQEAAAHFLAATTGSQLAEELAESARIAMAAAAAAVVLVDDAGDTVLTAGRHLLASALDDPAVRAEIAVLRRAGVVTIGSLDEVRASYPGLLDALIAARVEAFSIVPIGSEAPVQGALLCFFGRARALSAEDVELQLALTQQASLALIRVRLQDELLALALHDQLTGVANRRLLREHLIQGMAAAVRRGRPISMLAIDLDGFKSINDERGHQAGDEALRWVATAIGSAVRIDDVVGRFGGDEFLVLCHEADDVAAEQVAARVRAAIEGYPDRLPDGTALTASVGIAVCSPERASGRPEDFFAVADAALYRSKREGRDRISVDRF